MPSTATDRLTDTSRRAKRVARFAQHLGWLVMLVNALSAPVVVAQNDTITLGSVIAFTGKHSISAIHTRNGYQFAVDNINARGGVKIAGKAFKLNIKYLDDKSRPKEGAALVEQMVKEEGIQFMLGPYGTASILAAAEVTEKYGVPMIASTGASSSLFSEQNRYLFSILTTNDRYLTGIVDLAMTYAGQLGKKPEEITIALAFDKGQFSQEIRAGVIATSKAHALEVIIDDTIPKDLKDISSTLLKVLSLQPDLLLISGHARGAATAVRQIGEMNVTVPLIGLTHCEAARVLRNYPSQSENIICPTHWTPTVNFRGAYFGSASDYEREFKTAFPDYETVPYQTALGSAAVLVFKNAIERANSLDRAAVRDAIVATSLNSFVGPIQFANTGENSAKPMVLRQIQNGKFKIIVPRRASANANGLTNSRP